jgi:hypothetical protein
MSLFLIHTEKFFVEISKKELLEILFVTFWEITDEHANGQQYEFSLK